MARHRTILAGVLTREELLAVEHEFRRLIGIVEELANDASPGQPMGATDATELRERLKDLKALLRERADDPETGYADSLFRLSGYRRLASGFRLSAATHPIRGNWVRYLGDLRGDIAYELGRVLDQLAKQDGGKP